jgi:hypothetical protein
LILIETPPSFWIRIVSGQGFEAITSLQFRKRIAGRKYVGWDIACPEIYLHLEKTRGMEKYCKRAGQVLIINNLKMDEGIII